MRAIFTTNLVPAVSPRFTVSMADCYTRKTILSYNGREHGQFVGILSAPFGPRSPALGHVHRAQAVANTLWAYTPWAYATMGREPRQD